MNAPAPLVKDPDNIRLAMLGMVEGNGHPYSWSAIVNGQYDAAAMTDCGYPVIPQYLGAQPPGALGINGAKVTHVWCDDPEDAEKVSRASCVPHVLDTAEDAIGKVDAVFIATDIGSEHVDRARPFIEADVPVFIDKPLVDRADHLEQFIAWHDADKPFLSSSCMRYALEFSELRDRIAQVGDLRLITMTMAKTWERYGIHALEGVYALLPSGGYTSVTHTGSTERNLIHVKHDSGVDTILAVIDDLYGAFGHLSVFGTAGADHAAFSDTVYAFRTQLFGFVQFLRTGMPPNDFAETVEQMKIIIAGRMSREQGGVTVSLNDIGV